MERRVRSFAMRKGIQSLADYTKILDADLDEMNNLLDRTDN